MDYPELAARTRRFSYGQPRGLAVSGSGDRVVFLRSAADDDPRDALWVFDLATGTERLIADPGALTGADPAGQPPAEELALRERLRVSSSGIGSYALDAAGATAVFALAGALFRADLATGDVVRVPTTGPVTDPRPDPTGRRIAFATGGALHVVDPSGASAECVLAREDGVTWGLAEFIGAEEFRRYRGFWWAPDGEALLAARVDESRVNRWHLHDPATPENPSRSIAYPFAGSANADVTLHLLNLDGGWVDAHWDRHRFPYLVSACWTSGGPLITVLQRPQHRGLVLVVNPRTGETTVQAELSDPHWVEVVPGTPAFLPDNRVAVSGDLRFDGHDTRCLFADGIMITPPELYVRRLVGTAHQAAGSELIIEATSDEPSEQHVYAMSLAGSSAPPRARRLTARPGWHRAYAAGSTLVISSLSIEHAGVTHAVYRDGEPVGTIRSNAAIPDYTPRPALGRVTDRRLPSGVLFPRAHVAGRSLPVLVDIYGGPGHQEVIAARSAWLERQWWADQGFAVVVVDNRGTPGVTPGFEKAIAGRLGDVVLADQVDALHALAAEYPDLDLSKVAVRGWSFGGWLAALAVLRRPDVFHVGVAGAPVTDWTLYDTAYTERYLGLPVDAPDLYSNNNLVEIAEEPPVRRSDARPLMLIHGLIDDNVVAAHTLRLSAAMLRSGRPHSVIPLTGATHMAAGGLSERLLRLESEFIRQALSSRV